VQSRQGGGFYPTRGRVAQNEKDKRETRKLNGECSVVEVPPGVPQGDKAKARCAVTSVIQSPAANIGTVG
jgi:hypothetical protein